MRAGLLLCFCDGCGGGDGARGGSSREEGISWRRCMLIGLRGGMREWGLGGWVW